MYLLSVHYLLSLRVATLPGKTLKNLEFDNLGKKNLEKPGILTILRCLVEKFRFNSKNLSYSDSPLQSQVSSF